MKVPVYAHRFASVPSKWLDVPASLAAGWTGDPPEDGGHLIPASIVGLAEALLVANPAWRQFSRPDPRCRRCEFRLWRIDWADRIERAWAHLRGRGL